MVRIFTILLSLSLDLAFGDPPNHFHPLLLMGKWLNWGRVRAPVHQRFWFGVGWIVAGIGLFSLPWQILRDGRLSPSFFLLPFALKPVFAYRNLRRAVQSVAEALAAKDLAEARYLLSWHLVSRDTSDLSPAEVAGAAIESLAENLTDSLTAPLLAYAAGGLPAAWAYRFVNTADAMWGYRTEEFEQLGKFAARLDDALNYLPARLTGWLLIIAAWLVGEDAHNGAQTMLKQNRRTLSPNSGWSMSAMAGVLGVTLDKRNVYQLEGGTGTLDSQTVQRALRVADVGAGLVVLVAIVVALLSQKYRV